MPSDLRPPQVWLVETARATASYLEALERDNRLGKTWTQSWLARELRAAIAAVEAPPVSLEEVVERR